MLAPALIGPFFDRPYIPRSVPGRRKDAGVRRPCYGFRAVESPDREWLKTPEGREWLMSDEGGAWQRTEEGCAWMHSPDGRAWFDELAQQGWERSFRGEMPPPPEWAITPDVAPRIGDRVRLRETVTSLNGTSSSEGELMIVACLDLAPVSMEHVELRTIDGRLFRTMTRNSYLPAT